MADSPKEIRKDLLLETAVGFSMDVLSDAVLALRTGRAVSQRSEYAGRWDLRFRTRDGIGFHVVLQGTCWFMPPSGSPIQLVPGDLVVLPHGHEHCLADDPATRAEPVVISLEQPMPRLVEGRNKTVLLCGAYLTDRSRAQPLLAELPAFLHIPRAPGPGSPLAMALDLLAHELHDHRPGGAVVVPALLDTVLLYVLRNWHKEAALAGVGGGWSRALADPAIRTALDHIHENPGRAWTVELLGKEARLSRAAFAQRFAALTGQTPVAYLTWWRIVIAARLLRDSDSSLATIAQQVGYSSEFAFANAFKRHYRVPPGRYRRQVTMPADRQAASTDGQTAVEQ